jgi:hypothetical protein
MPWQNQGASSVTFLTRSSVICKLRHDADAIEMNRSVFRRCISLTDECCDTVLFCDKNVDDAQGKGAQANVSNTWIQLKVMMPGPDSMVDWESELNRDSVDCLEPQSTRLEQVVASENFNQTFC